MKRESYSDEIVNLSEEVEFESRSRGNSTHESLAMDMVLLECMIN